ncbi:unnamed protein product [Ambrosiozyma monospora]|uniref:Unnamed protein product n=1 Tax=Ambrosiozyma monospora TaxID=43982 RepID=A0A9W7DKB2_AMBMO|nr:unnamed protein product [Ambrosiozyma monospora]
MFPAAYVSLKDGSSPAAVAETEEEEDDDESAAAGKAKGPSATAEYDYDATETNELTFKEGDVITDIEFADEDWWLGNLNGERKLFPANFVSLHS